MRIVLDTGALFVPAALRETVTDAREAVLPAIAFAERCRHYARDGKSVEALRALVLNAGMTIEPFGEEEAQRLPPAAADDRFWRRHSRDALIAAHLREGDELWTTNPRDFEALGVPAARMRAW